MRARTFVTVVLLVGLTGGTPLAQNPNPKFNAERVRLQEWTRKNRAAQGLQVTESLVAINPFKDTKITIRKVAPGGTLALTVPGKYPTDTVILSERDGVALVAATTSATSYSVRMTVAPDEGPGFARLFAMTPISFDQNQTFLAVAFIDAVYRLDLKSANGITVKVSPLEKTFTIDEFQMNARVNYQAEFYRLGEPKPFETLTGFQDFNSHSEPSGHFDIRFSQSASSPEAEMEELNKQLSNPKLTPAQREALMARMMALQQRMIEGMVKGLQSDPAGMQKKADDFGCGLLQVSPGKAGAAEGMMQCGKNFSGGVLKLMGTMTLAK
jgi:hypothetical protein